MSTPDLFTITEAAVVLRIGRTTACELARRDLATGGGEGLDVIRVGGQLRVPRVALVRMIGAPISPPVGVWAPVAPAAQAAGPDGASGTLEPTSEAPTPPPDRDVDERPVVRGRRRVESVGQLRFGS
jgi:hypothetical protein